MLPKRPPNPTLRIALVILMLFAAGCATRPLSGVSVKTLASDLVFGVPPLSEGVAPANTLPGGDFSFLADAGDGSTPPVFRRRPRSGEAEVDPCPVAPVGSAPLDSVPQTIASPPRTGVYTYRYTVAYPKTQFVFEGFEKRGIGNIRTREQVDQNDPEAARFDFRFTMTQELVGSNYQVLSATVFGVDQTSRSLNPTGPSAFAGENPKGIYLLTIEQTINEKGKVREVKFNANPPIKYMTLPGIIGAEGAFRTTSIDPTTQSSISLQGETVRRQPVDACGEMIDTWYMTATQMFTFIDPDDGQTKTVTTNLEYGIATQFGGMLVVEHYEVPAASPDSILDFAIGSVSPK